MFDLEKKETFSQREERVLALWKKKNIFQQSLENRQNDPVFSFYDGPPFATGLPHYGHLLAGTIKDVIPRYKTMKGYFVKRRFGWDCHGLPVENEIEKAKGLSGAPEIEQFGIEKFNQECKKIVLRYTSEWEKTVERMGRWVDFSSAYKTMDLSYMESVWWAFKTLYEKGLVYRGFKVMPFSAKLGTPLSNFEANLNYQEVQDPSLTAQFAVDGEEGTYFLAWTTTPWTLVSNLALIVHPEEPYVKISVEGKKGSFILAKKRVSALIKEPYTVLEEYVGKDLENQKYHPLFPYFSAENPAFFVICDPFVTMDDGTGIVHAAPAFGEVDFFACQKVGISLVCPVDHNGKFTKEVPEFSGTFVKDADKAIMQRLKKEGKVFHQSQIRHRYPFCWRSDTPLIYRAVRTWFIGVEQIKERLLRSTEQIRFVPEHIKTGRFGKWLENARDWAVSRNRYWGTPIPIWESEGGEDLLVLGGKKELEELTKETVHDLHRHHIDSLKIEKNGKTYTRIPEVFDCWFESGCMPYAQNHYPFEGVAETEKAFPADFIAEGLDQTRGWFYTLSVIAAALFDKPAFKNVVVNGIILAEDGAKMSKRLKNYPDPTEVIDRYGADAIRLYMLQSPAVRADDFRFSSKGVELVLRQILLPFYNSYVFLATYAKIYGWSPKAVSHPTSLLDRWIVSKSENALLSVENALNVYDLSGAVGAILLFIEELTNWYIRRSRPRFWQDEATLDRESAFGSLYAALFKLTKIAAPFIPFLTETIYQQLRQETDPVSVHLCDYPKYAPSLRDEALEEEMHLAQKAVSLGHFLRKECKVKVRQPLSCAIIAAFSKKDAELLSRQKSLIQEELNVKEIAIHADDAEYVDYVISPNFPVLGKKVGRRLPQIQKVLKGWSQQEIKQFLQANQKEIAIEEEVILLEKGDVKVGRHSKPSRKGICSENLYIALDTELTEELLLEGIMREIVNKVNLQRKEMGLEVTDRIILSIEVTQKISACFSEYLEHIQKEVLATRVDLQKKVVGGKPSNINGEETQIGIEKAPSEHNIS
ncbi:MAG: isoleucine--tRNA ligase [Chlamydiota bacterium]